jgi:hypothetical protein
MVLSAAPVLLGIDPVLGSVAGGTTVTVSGSEFTASAWCRFGTVLSIAPTVSSSTRISCVSPSVVASGFVAVQVSNDNTAWTSDVAAFAYVGAYFL